MKSLVAFEAVARHLSLTRAGQELLISREAVSRQIRVLEQYLGVKLFDRLHRAVALTPAGHHFQEVVRDSLENIAHVAATVSKSSGPLKITVSATVAIASFWLTPRASLPKDDAMKIKANQALIGLLLLLCEAPLVVAASVSIMTTEIP